MSSSKFSHLKLKPFARTRKGIAKDGLVPVDLFIEELRAGQEEPIPPDIMDYLCQVLAGKVTSMKGRPPTPAYFKVLQATTLMERYDRLFAWLKVRKIRYGHLDGWSCVRDAEFWEGPPSERAAKIVAGKYGHGVKSWRRVLNIVSEHR